MASIFPKPIVSLPEVDIAFEGVKAYVSQGENEQVVFIEFEKTTDIPEHSHESQWEIVLEGKVDYFEEGVKHTYRKGGPVFCSQRKKAFCKGICGVRKYYVLQSKGPV